MEPGWRGRVVVVGSTHVGGPLDSFHLLGLCLLLGGGNILHLNFTVFVCGTHFCLLLVVFFLFARGGS